MYDPNEAKKSYLSLFKDNGASAAVQSGIFVVSWYLFNKYIQNQETPLSYLVPGYFFFCAYFTWKPKFIRFVRGHLRGKKYRDISDDE
ncbi:MAG TPA: hypothetical protein DDY37_06080 [Legionella sp.]|nr:hypothetical protein [Legionella sp.]